MLTRRPDLEIRFLRGNVNTRLAKLDAGEYDAIILAAAGLIRLGFEDRITSAISVDDSLPAGGQGAVGIECRSADSEIHALLAPLHHQDTATRVTAERALNKHLNGGCQVPIACYAVLEGEQIWLRGLVGRSERRSAAQRPGPRATRRRRSAGRASGRRPSEPGRRRHSESGLRRGRSRVTGWRLLLTRPADESAALGSRLAEQGIFSSSLPLLDIVPIPAADTMREVIQELDRYCAVIVVSKPAARIARGTARAALAATPSCEVVQRRRGDRADS